MASPFVTSAVYPFEGLLPDLESPPIAARRALDSAGVRLSIEGWRSLAPAEREELTVIGVADRVDAGLVASLVASARPAAGRVHPVSDPDPTTPPASIVEALGPDLALEARRWARLRAIDRYALAHVQRRAAAMSALSILTEAAAAILAGPPMVEERATLPAPVHPLRGEATAEPPPIPPLSSHLTDRGEVHMVDVAKKPETQRRAVATGSVLMRRETLEALVNHQAPKGEVLATARVAAIMGAKRTYELVPLCHIVSLTHVEVALEPAALDAARGAVHVTATVEAHDRTGCEMEAMVAVTTACLTVYDMLKGIDRDMVISEVKLLEKCGGRSGHYHRGDVPPARGEP